VALALEDKWVWDFWLCRDGADWHLYFLQADRSLGDPELRHWNVSQGHAVSQDLRQWQLLGTCLAPSPGPAADDYTTWTGSVLKDDAGLWHLFYTGTAHADAGMKQRLFHATSTDGHGWRRAGGEPGEAGLILDIGRDAGGAAYEEFQPGFWHDRAMRDPWVIRDPRGAGWLMFFTARVPGRAEPNAGGAIGLATSPDLYHWELKPPVYAGGDFGQLEVPQVFELGGRWYCLFCTDKRHWSRSYAAEYPGEPVSGTHYLIADSPLGPWKVAPGAFLDGAPDCRRYSGKVILGQDGEAPAGLSFMAFANTRPDGSFAGTLIDPLPMDVLPDGRLVLKA
jgi:beta-fructofuranosidase